MEIADFIEENYNYILCQNLIKFFNVSILCSETIKLMRDDIWPRETERKWISLPAALKL